MTQKLEIVRTIDGYAVIDEQGSILYEEKDNKSLSVTDQRGNLHSEATGRFIDQGGDNSRAPTKLGKVVSSKTYFHGTWDKSPKELDPESMRTGVLSFTDDETHAEGFGSNVYKIRLDVRNPIDLRSLGSGGEGDEEDPGESISAREIQTYLADEYGIEVDLGNGRDFTTALIRHATKKIKQQAVEKGYDGILVMDFKDREVEEVQVFHKNQIQVLPK